MPAAGATDVSDRSSINGVLTKITEKWLLATGCHGSSRFMFYSCSQSSSGPPVAWIGCPGSAETRLRVTLPAMMKQGFNHWKLDLGLMLYILLKPCWGLMLVIKDKSLRHKCMWTSQCRHPVLKPPSSPTQIQKLFLVIWQRNLSNTHLRVSTELGKLFLDAHIMCRLRAPVPW